MALQIDGRRPGFKKEILKKEVDGLIIEYKERGINTTVTPHWYVWRVLDKETGEEIDTSICLRRQRQNNESEWHLNEKHYYASIFEGQNEITVRNEDNEARIADVMIKNTVIELQNSSMDLAEFKSRNYHYISQGKKIGWVLSPSRSLINSTKEHIYGLNPNPKQYTTFVVKYSKLLSFFDLEHLELENVAVFIDIEDGNLGQLVHIEPRVDGSYKWEALFRVVKKENILVQIDESNIYSNIREKLGKRFYSEHIKNLYARLTHFLDEKREKVKDFKFSHAIRGALSNVTNERQLEAAIKHYERQGMRVTPEQLLVLDKKGREDYLKKIRLEIIDMEKEISYVEKEIERVVVPPDFPKFMLKFLKPYIRDIEIDINKKLAEVRKIRKELVDEKNALSSEYSNPSIPKIINTANWLKTA